VCLALAQPLRAASVQDVLRGAYSQIGITTRYDGAYRRLAYPGGDVPLDRGACTDVLVRAYRRAGIDLQLLVHEDMLRAFDAYPGLWGLSRPDASIDHRRVPNLATFFRRHGVLRPVSARAADYEPGDIVTWRLPSGVPHIGLVSDRAAGTGRYLVVHNIGAGVRLEDVLFEFELAGHYRYALETPEARPGPRTR